MTAKEKSYYFRLGYSAYPFNHYYPEAGTDRETVYLEGWHFAAKEGDLTEFDNDAGDGIDTYLWDYSKRNDMPTPEII